MALMAVVSKFQGIELSVISGYNHVAPHHGRPWEAQYKEAQCESVSE